MKVGLCVPYRETSPERQYNLNRLVQHYGAEYPMFITDSEPGLPFNRGQARNRAVQRAADYCDVVIINDVDCLPELEQIDRAISDASAGFLVYPFDSVRYLLQDGSEDMRVGESDGGCFVVSPRRFQRAGGCAELYAWGWEDKIFLQRWLWSYGKPIRLPGELTHLWHPYVSDPHEVYRHKSLIEAYEACQSVVEFMLLDDPSSEEWVEAQKKDGSLFGLRPPK